MAHASNQRPRAAVTAAKLDEDAARRKAIEYCLFHYPTLYTAGPRASLRADRWVFAIVLSSPMHGVLGEVGELHLDASTGEVLQATDKAAVVAAGEQLYEQNKASARTTAPGE